MSTQGGGVLPDMDGLNSKKYSGNNNLFFNVIGVLGIIAIITSAVFLVSYARSAFRSIPVTETAEPSIIFSVDDFFNLINAGRYDLATERYAYTKGNLRTMVDPKIARIFPKGSIERAEVSGFKVDKNNCTANLKVYLKNGKIVDYKETLKMYKDENKQWKIDCSNIDDPAFWE